MGVKIPVDFSDTPERGSVRVPEGDYVVTVKKVEQTKAKSSGNPMLIWTMEFKSGPKDVKGKRIRDNHTLTPEALWTLRNALEAIGYKVPTGPMKFDADKMVINREVGISVYDDEYNGRISSKIADYIPASSVGNVTKEAEVPGDIDEGDEDDDWEDDDEEDDAPDPTDIFADDDDDEEDEDDDEEDEEEEDEDDEVELSFDDSDLDDAKGPELKKYLKEAMDAGYEFDLPEKPKVAQVREALQALFLDDEDDDDVEDWDLDDLD